MFFLILVWFCHHFCLPVTGSSSLALHAVELKKKTGFASQKCRQNLYYLSSYPRAEAPGKCRPWQVIPVPDESCNK